MSAYGEYEKDAIVESIKDFMEFRKAQGISLQETVSEVLDASKEGLERGLYNFMDS